MPYSARDQVVTRDVRDGVPYFEWPQTVIEDGGRGLLVAQVPGTVGRVPFGYPDDAAVLLEQLASPTPQRVERAWQHTRTRARR